MKTINVVKKALLKMDPKENPPHDTSVLLLSTAIVGAKEGALVKFTGIPRARVRELLHRGRDQRIFTRDGRIRAEWFDGGKNSGVAFYCDVLCLDGLLVRAR